LVNEGTRFASDEVSHHLELKVAVDMSTSILFSKILLDPLMSKAFTVSRLADRHVSGSKMTAQPMIRLSTTGAERKL